MKALLTTFCLFSFLFVQSQSNNIESNLAQISNLIHWQVIAFGKLAPPQKTIFNSAFSVPNVLVTDTLNNYQKDYII
jgi:hypothetical protein